MDGFVELTKFAAGKSRNEKENVSKHPSRIFKHFLLVKRFGTHTEHFIHL